MSETKFNPKAGKKREKRKNNIAYLNEANYHAVENRRKENSTTAQEESAIEIRVRYEEVTSTLKVNSNFSRQWLDVGLF